MRSYVRAFVCKYVWGKDFNVNVGSVIVIRSKSFVPACTTRTPRRCSTRRRDNTLVPASDCTSGARQKLRRFARRLWMRGGAESIERDLAGFNPRWGFRSSDLSNCGEPLGKLRYLDAWKRPRSKPGVEADGWRSRLRR